MLLPPLYLTMHTDHVACTSSLNTHHPSGKLANVSKQLHDLDESSKYTGAEKEDFEGAFSTNLDLKLKCAVNCSYSQEFRG